MGINGNLDSVGGVGFKAFNNGFVAELQVYCGLLCLTGTEDQDVDVLWLILHPCYLQRVGTGRSHLQLLDKVGREDLSYRKNNIVLLSG